MPTFQSSTPSVTSRPQGRVAPGVPQVLAVVLACWFMISPFVIRYPITIDGNHAALRDRGVALVLLFTALCWYRTRTHRRHFQLAFALFAALLVVEAISFGEGSGGRLGGAPWNELVSGALMLVTVVVGWRDTGTWHADGD
jgi:hypothetical protein